MGPIIYLETLCSAVFTTAKLKTLVLQTLKSGLILKMTAPQVKVFWLTGWGSPKSPTAGHPVAFTAAAK